MSNTQTDLAWQLAQQKGNLIGSWTKDGQLIRNDLPSWEERKLMRQNKGSEELFYQGMPKKKNPTLVAEPTRKGLDNKQFRKDTKSYADTWREQNRLLKDPMYVKGLRTREEVINQ